MAQDSEVPNLGSSSRINLYFPEGSVLSMGYRRGTEGFSSEEICLSTSTPLGCETPCHMML